jgi:hypothetical protein
VPAAPSRRGWRSGDSGGGRDLPRVLVERPVRLQRRPDDVERSAYGIGLPRLLPDGLAVVAQAAWEAGVRALLLGAALVFCASFLVADLPFVRAFPAVILACLGGYLLLREGKK